MAIIRQINYFKYQQAKICIKHTLIEQNSYYIQQLARAQLTRAQLARSEYALKSELRK